MPYGTRDAGGGHLIRTFRPDDTEDVFYKRSDTTLFEIIEKVKEKWPDVDIENINITAEHIQTDCLGYDQYDSMDYTDFIKVERIG